MVDDDASNLKIASYILTRENMRVSCLQSGLEVIRFLETNRPDLVLLDIHMAGLDGFETLSALKGNQRTADFPKLMTGARWHHERYDGTGYPDGLQGEEIPMEARMIAVADAYDAMTSKRSYRDALPQECVRRELENGRGTQFDPVFADIMLAMIEEDREYDMREK